MIPHFGFRISDCGSQKTRSALRTPHSALAVLALALALAAPWNLATGAAANDDWWNASWSHRTRVRVRIAAEEPLGFRYRAPSASPEDLLAAEAWVRPEVPLQAGAAREIRVVDAGGNVLPCSAAEPDSRGLVRVVFPARRTLAGQLASPIQDGTKTVTLNVGRNKAVTPGLRFFALAAAARIATLEVEAVDAATATARIIDKSTPTIAQGVPVESEVLTRAEYAVYYGNAKPEGAAPAWTPSVAPVTQYGWTLTTGSAPTSAAQLRAAMQSSPSFVGAQTHEVAGSTANPLSYDSESFYVSAYDGYIYAPVPGVYRFAIDSGGPAYLFLNGKLAAQRPGFFFQTGQFEHRGKLELAEGYHHLTLCATESARYHVTRLAWQPITGTVFSLVPPGVFVNRIAAEAVGFETRDRREQAFFSYRQAPMSVLHGEKRYQFVQFQNLTSVKAKAGADAEQAPALNYVWEFGDGTRDRETAPGHLYDVSSGAASAPFPVTLLAYDNGKLAGECKQTIHLAPRTAERLNLSLDIVSFANIVYYDERTSIAVRLRNTGFSPVVVRAVANLESSAGKQVIVNQELPIEGQDENFCILPVDMKLLDDKTALIDLDITLGGQPVLDTAARVIRSADLARRGTVTIEEGQVVLGPGGAVSGIATTAEFPTNNYEVTLQARRLAGRDLCNVTVPVGDAFCTLRSSAWDAPMEADRWHALRIRVPDAGVEAWLNGRRVAAVARAACPTALPLACEDLKPFGLHAALNTQVAVRAIALGRIEGAPPPAPAEPKPPAKPAPRPAPDRRRNRLRLTEEQPAEPPKGPAAATASGGRPDTGPRPAKWTPLFDGSLRGWKTVAESDLALLRRGLDGLLDFDGRRVMISTEIEDADRHLEWVFARFIHEKHIASRKSVLLFGDRMANPAPPGKSFTDYVAILEQRLKDEKRPFQFVERTTGLLPTLADVALFARTLQTLSPVPDVIVICPGLSDVQQAVGHRDFARAFDVMIDAIRATGHSARIVVVAPPPSPRAPRVSRLYAEAAERVARDHHVAFVDLDALLTKGQDDWVRAAYAIPESDGLFYENPGEAAQRRIADAIGKQLQR